MKNSFSSAFPSPSLRIWNWIMSIFCFRRRCSSKTTSWSLWNRSSFHLCIHLLRRVLTFDKENSWEKSVKIPTKHNGPELWRTIPNCACIKSPRINHIDLCLFYTGSVVLCLHLLHYHPSSWPLFVLPWTHWSSSVAPCLDVHLFCTGSDLHHLCLHLLFYLQQLHLINDFTSPFHKFTIEFIGWIRRSLSYKIIFI